MKIGAHLPLADFGGGCPTALELSRYVSAARDLGYATVAANDHLFWQRPWLDGPTALASVAAAAGDMRLATTVTLPVLRHPVVVAKSLTSLAALSTGPVIGGLGPGSSRTDYDAVGVPFEERWTRFDSAIRLVKTLVAGASAEEVRFYPGASPLAPVADPPPQIWFGSWGSDRRFESLAAVADGWFASAYNATSDQFAASRARLNDHLRAANRDPESFPNSVATMWLHITEDRAEANALLDEVLAPALNRDPAQLKHLPIGGAQHCSEVLASYAAAGAREVVLWPVLGGLDQLERCAAAAADA
jgi:alkanesulfonate monooxygenase SsuD/methylene tetrahydromethanopterin reductase-like flavin-dependent oxidoreductase (luciferase family)